MVVDPDANAAGAITTAYVDMSKFRSAMAIILVGTLGTAATVDAKLVQATDSGGTGSKDITGKAITQLVKASNDDDQAIINVRSEELDVTNSFDFVALTYTTGTATSDGSAVLLGLDAVHGPASDNNLASVQEIVS